MTTYDTLMAHHYRGYRIYYDPKPVPVRVIGPWSFAHNDYDGGPWETGGPPMDNRCGDGKSVSDCKDKIDELEDEQ